MQFRNEVSELALLVVAVTALRYQVTDLVRRGTADILCRALEMLLIASILPVMCAFLYGFAAQNLQVLVGSAAAT